MIYRMVRFPFFFFLILKYMELYFKNIESIINRLISINIFHLRQFDINIFIIKYTKLGYVFFKRDRDILFSKFSTLLE